MEREGGVLRGDGDGRGCVLHVQCAMFISRCRREHGDRSDVMRQREWCSGKGRGVGVVEGVA